MRGNLTIDKASMNLSYFLYSVRIVAQNGGRVSRKDFGRIMGELIGVPSQKDGRENRTPYNKSKLPRYFGFIDVATDSDGTYLILTLRGKKLNEYIEEEIDKEPSDRYFISPKHRKDFIDLIFDSVIFDSFGKNNCGAEQSNTDVEPPKIVFKVIYELGSATAEEICYVMYGLNRGVFNSFTEAISAIKKNRESYKYDYSSIMEKWGITNIVHDCKIINIFTDPSIQLLYSEKDQEKGKTFYWFTNNVTSRHMDQIKTISPIYQPLRMTVFADSNESTLEAWINDSVFGRVSDDSFILRKRENDHFLGINENGTYKAGIFDKSLCKAFSNPKSNVFVLIDDGDENEIIRQFGKFASLLNRIDDLSDPYHGWSLEGVEDKDVYNYLAQNATQTLVGLRKDVIRIPSNIHIIGMNTMDNIDKNQEYDYTFTKVLVSDGEGTDSLSEFDDAERVKGGSNILLYGVPGAGKSWTIQNDYCNDERRMERLVFHPDYTYSDFVGQILPNVMDGVVNYKFTEGPFTSLLKKAYTHPKTEYFLVIEEINRGNAPAIFGEVFQLLDRDEDGTSEYGITNPDIATIVYGNPNHKVRIPSNMSIIGTMNTSDQNVFTLDTAFQRRWNMRLIENSFKNHTFADKKILDTDVSWQRFCEVINNVIVNKNITMTSSEDKRLGAYFVRMNDLEYHIEVDDDSKTHQERMKARLLNYLFAEKVLKYLWDDAFKFSRQDVFKNNVYKTLEEVVNHFNSKDDSHATGNDRLDIFKQEIIDDLLAQK